MKSLEINKCPVCKKEADFEYGAFEVKDNAGYYPFACMKCGAKGKEWYNLTFVELEATL